jgi:WD40 repeat protein
MRHQQTVVGAQFSPDGQTVLTASHDRTARLWPIRAPLTGDVERIVLWIETATGLELESGINLRVLNADAWHARRQRLTELGGPPME